MPEPTDKETIALLRARIGALESAIQNFMDALEPTAARRKEAWEAMERWRHDWPAEFVVPRCVAAFLDAYRSTLDERAAAGRTLASAVTTDFRTAVLTMPDFTDEQRAYWLNQTEQPA